MSGRVVRIGGDDPSLTVYPTPAGLVLATLGALLFVGAGVIAIVSGSGRQQVVGVLSVVVFGLFGVLGVLGVWLLLRAGPALVIDRRGIDDRSSVVAAGFVPWSEITGIVTWEFAGQPYLVVGVEDPEAVLRRVPSLVRLVLRMSIRMTGTPINIATTALPITVDELLHEIAAFAPRA